jgi:hypothetical protein
MSPTECGVSKSVIVKTLLWGGPGLMGTVAPWGNKQLLYTFHGIAVIIELIIYVLVTLVSQSVFGLIMRR